MDFDVTWTDSAVADLEAIVGSIAAARPRAARKVGDAIAAQVEKLGVLPTLGSPYRPRGDVRETAYKKYRIFYRVKAASRSVEILAIWHGRVAGRGSQNGGDRRRERAVPAARSRDRRPAPPAGPEGLTKSTHP